MTMTRISPGAKDWEADLKERARECGLEIVLGARFMDDYLIGVRGEVNRIPEWLENLNSKDQSIQVTLEMEKDGALPFLDILVQRKNAAFVTNVYRKPCNTLQVVPFSSFTDPRYKRSAVQSDVVRAWRYCKSQKLLEKELKVIEAKFSSYGYPSSFVNGCIASTLKDQRIRRRALPAPVTETEVKPVRVTLPYMGPTFHALARLGNKIGISFVAKSSNTIGSRLCSKCKVSRPPEQEDCVVYGIRCSCGAIYIGETDREAGTRIHEHELSWGNPKDGKSAFKNHRDCGPNFSPSQESILAKESHQKKRLLTEAALIRTVGQRETVLASSNDKQINRNVGLLLPDRWLPALSRFPPDLPSTPPIPLPPPPPPPPPSPPPSPPNTD